MSDRDTGSGPRLSPGRRARESGIRDRMTAGQTCPFGTNLARPRLLVGSLSDPERGSMRFAGFVPSDPSLLGP